jgi:hypothetical protein
MRTTLALLAAACALVAAGCGTSAKTSGGGPDANDKRAAALDCLKNQQKLDARPLGADSVQVGDPAGGPRITFFLTNGEAEAAQFEGRGEGAEQIGPALLFVRKAGDDQLKQIETCLDDLQSG